MKKRALILIDGSNFYFKLRDLGFHHLLLFNFSHFAQFLTGETPISHTTYYVGKVRTDGTKKTAQLHANQQRLFAHLHKHHIRYSLGYLLKANGCFMKRVWMCK